MESQIITNGIELYSLGKVNIILGKNGVGKSTLLRKLARSKEADDHQAPNTIYITPERGGLSQLDGNIENTYHRDRKTIRNFTDKNYYANYRQLTQTKLTDLSSRVLQDFKVKTKSGDENAKTDDDVINEINDLQDRVYVKLEGRSNYSPPCHFW